VIADVWCPWCRDHQRAELTADRDAHRARADAAEAEVARQSESYQRVMVQASALALARDEAEAEVARLLSAAQDEAARAVVEYVAKSAALERERDAALADAAGLRAVAPRTTPPTEAEAAAHNAALGWWLISREGVAPPAAVDAFRGDGDVTAHLPFVRGATWLPLDRDGRPTAWPVAAPDAATQRAGEGGAGG